MESPTFDENQLKPIQSIYKKVKPSIDKEKAKNIPGMIELWKEIDRLQDIYDQNSGKTERQPETPVLSQSQLYYLKHQLIELRTQQYYLLDSDVQTIRAHANKGEYFEDVAKSHLSIPILPRGLMNTKDDENFKNPYFDKNGAAASNPRENEILEGNKPFFDFRNQEHLYQLIQHYGDLESQIEDYPDSLINNLLWTLDFYIDKAALSEQQRLIVELKKYRVSNKEIREQLKNKLGIDHRENYISTIWNKAVGIICEAVELNYDEYLCKDYEKAWKKCNRCGKILLRDPRNFVRKAKALDGLTGRCKKCDKELR